MWILSLVPNPTLGEGPDSRPHYEGMRGERIAVAQISVPKVCRTVRAKAQLKRLKLVEKNSENLRYLLSLENPISSRKKNYKSTESG